MVEQIEVLACMLSDQGLSASASSQLCQTWKDLI